MEPSPVETAEDARSASSDVEERRFSAASEARENGIESRRNGRTAAPSPPGTTQPGKAASGDVEEGRFSAASEARENGTESRRDGRKVTGRLRYGPIG
jgi:hypothetical protein